MSCHRLGRCHVLAFMPMDDRELFEQHRTRLFGIAYRMLGDVADADDLVQETFLRWHAEPRLDVVSAEGWLVTVVTRLAIDRLRKRAAERLDYPGSWLPEPVATDAAPATDRAVEIASDLSIAFLVLLDRLTPPERAALLLRDVFDLSYPEIAGVLGKSEVASRQMIHRARARVRGKRPRRAALPEGHRELLERFLQALHTEDRDALMAVLAPDATFTSDGGGKTPAARRVLIGRDRIVKFLLGLERKRTFAVRHDIERVNGELAVITRVDGLIFAVTAIEVADDRIGAFYRVLNPDKLRRLGGDVVGARDLRRVSPTGHNDEPTVASRTAS